MKFTKFTFFILILSIASAGLLFAGGEQEAEGGAGKVTTISFLSHIYKPWNDKLTEEARNFEQENPGVKIEYATVPHADLNTKLMTTLSAGSASDILGVYGPWMEQLVSNGWIAPAPEYVQEDIRQNCVPVAGVASEYEGKNYGYIQHVGIPTPVINLDLYKEAGVEAPSTYDELFQVNKKLDKFDADGNMVQAGTTLCPTIEGSWNIIHWSGILAAYEGRILQSDLKKAAFNNTAGGTATEIYSQLAHPNFLDWGDAFTIGKSAMTWTGPWSRSNYRKNAPDLNFKAIPPLTGETQAISMYSWFWVVNAESSPEQQEWAWKFNNYLSNDQNYLEMAKEIGFLTFRKANFEDEEFMNDEWIQAFREAINNATIYYEKIPNWEKVDVLIGRELERLLVGETSITEMLDTAERKVNEELAAQF